MSERPRIPETRDEEAIRLIKDLKQLELSYQGFESEDERLQADRRIDVLCGRLVELGVDLELLARAEKFIEE